MLLAVIALDTRPNSGKGYETYLGYIEKHFPTVDSFDDLIYYGQANQAMALTFGIEHWRRIKGRCWGTLFWQLNDCWPTQSWAVIDSLGEPKAAYYAAKRFYAPLLLSLMKVDGSVEAHLVNDMLSNVTGELTLRLLDASGAEIAQHMGAVTAPANAASGALSRLELQGATAGLVQAAFVGVDGAVLAENILLIGEPKDMEQGEGGVSVGIGTVGDGTAILTVTAAERFAAFVWLRFEGMNPRIPTFSDNWFHLLPGEERTITVGNLPVGLSEDSLRSRLRLRHL